MTKTKKENNLDKLIEVLKQFPNPKKKGDLSKILEQDDFHNRDQTEDDYQEEQKRWLESIKKKKKPADS